MFTEQNETHLGQMHLGIVALENEIFEVIEPDPELEREMQEFFQDEQKMTDTRKEANKISERFSMPKADPPS